MSQTADSLAESLSSCDVKLVCESLFECRCEFTARLQSSGRTCGGTGHHVSHFARMQVSTPAWGSYSFVTYLCYLLYPPLYIAGPTITFNAFASQVCAFYQRPHLETNHQKLTLHISFSCKDGCGSNGEVRLVATQVGGPFQGATRALLEGC